MPTLDEAMSTSAFGADTPTLRRLGYRAVEEGWPAPSDKAFDELDPAGRHIGILVHVMGWDGKLGTTVPPDALGIVTWALALDGRDDRVIIHIAIPVGELAQLQRIAIAAETGGVLLDAARRYLGRLKFEAQAREELERLLRGDFDDTTGDT